MSQYPAMPVSQVVQAIPEALSIYINQLVYDQKRRGHDIVTLSLGEAFFDIPLHDFHRIDYVRGYHYSDSQGIPPLRKKIAQYYGQYYGAEVNGETEVLVSAGSKAIIFMAMQVALNAGDEVIMHEPAWLSYQEQARLAGGTARFIPFDEAVDNFHTHFSPATRMVVINNPNNPAGRVYTADELLSLYRQCRSRGIYLLVDEAYSDFLLDDSFISMARLVPDKDGVIVVNSLSKNLGMSGWRVGYAISHPATIQLLLKVNQHTITCAPTVLLLYLAEYFDDIIAVTLPQVREVVRKRQRLAEHIDGLGLKRLAGDSTFYFFLSTEQFAGSSLDLALHLLLYDQIAIVPGSAYGASTENFVRVSIGTESEERIHEALGVFQSTLRSSGRVRTDDIKGLLHAQGLHYFTKPS